MVDRRDVLATEALGLAPLGVVRRERHGANLHAVLEDGHLAALAGGATAPRLVPRLAEPLERLVRPILDVCGASDVGVEPASVAPHLPPEAVALDLLVQHVGERLDWAALPRHVGGVVAVEVDEPLGGDGHLAPVVALDVDGLRCEGVAPLVADHPPRGDGLQTPAGVGVGVRHEDGDMAVVQVEVAVDAPLKLV